MKRVATIGEIMLRISPVEKGEIISQATNFRIEPGGSESNVAIALSNLGLEAEFITVLPDESPLSKKIIQHLEQFGVIIDNVIFSGDRLGLYWTENGVGPRNSSVVYDRVGSAFYKMKKAHIYWDQINKNNNWFHFSGITPAVSKSAYELLLEGVRLLNIPYSVDLNYRQKLWQWVGGEKQRINNVMTHLCSNATLIVANETDIQNIFNINNSEQVGKDDYKYIATQMFNKFRNLKYIAISLRDSLSATHNIWTGVLFCKSETISTYAGLTFDIDNIVDRVGTGDSFCAGIIYGLLHEEEKSYQDVIEFAVTLSALNHSTKGDSSRFSANEVLKVVNSRGSGRIDR